MNLTGHTWAIWKTCQSHVQIFLMSWKIGEFKQKVSCSTLLNTSRFKDQEMKAPILSEGTGHKQSSRYQGWMWHIAHRSVPALLFICCSSKFNYFDRTLLHCFGAVSYSAQHRVFCYFKSYLITCYTLICEM